MVSNGNIRHLGVRGTAVASLESRFGVNVSVVVALVVSFGVGVLVPRLALAKLGEASYGVYALIVGFSGVLSFADLGLIPGLTLVLARLVAMGEVARLYFLLRRVDRLVVACFACLAAGCGGLMYMSLHNLDRHAFYAFGLFALATLWSARAEIRSTLICVSGAVGAAYLLRSVYSLLFLLFVVIMGVLVGKWDGPWPVCLGQLSASWSYYALVNLYSGRRLTERKRAAHARRSDRSSRDDTRDLLREALRLSKSLLKKQVP